MRWEKWEDRIKEIAEDNYIKGYEEGKSIESTRKKAFKNVSPAEAEIAYNDGLRVFCLDTKTYELIDLKFSPYGYAIQKFVTAGDLFFVMR